MPIHLVTDTNHKLLFLASYIMHIFIYLFIILLDETKRAFFLDCVTRLKFVRAWFTFTSLEGTNKAGTSNQKPVNSRELSRWTILFITKVPSNERTHILLLWYEYEGMILQPLPCISWPFLSWLTASFYLPYHIIRAVVKNGATFHAPLESCQRRWKSGYAALLHWP
jgi:hypothetical protein